MLRLRQFKGFVRLDALFGTCTDTEKFIPHGGASPQSLIVLLFQGQPRRHGLHCGINSGDLHRIATQPLRTTRCNMMRLDALFGTDMDTAEFTPSGGPPAQPPLVSPSLGHPRRRVFTAASSAVIYTGCRPSPLWMARDIGAFDIDIAKLTPRGEARAQPPHRLALLRMGRLGSFDAGPVRSG